MVHTVPDGFHEDDDHPSRYSVWPTHRKGMLYPDSKPIPTWKDLIGLVFILTVMAGFGFGIYFLFVAVDHS